MNAPAEKLILLEERQRAPERALPSTSSDATNLLAAIAAAAGNREIDVVKVKELYAIHKEVCAWEAKKAFAAAMALAQAEIQPVAAKALNVHTGSNYAKLEAIDKAITPIHTKFGLSISYDTETKNDADPIPQGYLRIVAFVRHPLGHEVRHHIDLPPDVAGSQGKTNKTMVQAIGSTNSYGRRYLKLMIFNVSTFDDKDGNNRKKPRDDADHSEDGEQRRDGALPEYPGDLFLKNLRTWKDMMERGEKTADEIIAFASTRYTLSEGQKQKIRSAGGKA